MLLLLSHGSLVPANRRQHSCEVCAVILSLSLAFLFLLPTLPHLDASTGSGGGGSSGGGGGDGVVRNGTRALTDMLTCFGSELNRRRKGEYDHII
jgi:hypothetical protein